MRIPQRALETLKKIYANPKVKKGLGVVLIIIGLIALVTPLTPGSWLILVGLGFFGVRILFWEKIVSWVRNRLRR